MPTDIAQHQIQTYAHSADSRARDFVLRGIAWSLSLFALMRVSWFEIHAVLPLTRLQAGAAQGVFGAPRLPIDVTLACSGADALALCVGAILAYPASWAARLRGAAGGIVVVEFVFDYPGLGQGLVNAVADRDIPTIQFIVLLLAAFYVFMNIVSDVIALWATPRRRFPR